MAGQMARLSVLLTARRRERRKELTTEQRRGTGWVWWMGRRTAWQMAWQMACQSALRTVLLRA